MLRIDTSQIRNVGQWPPAAECFELTPAAIDRLSRPNADTDLARDLAGALMSVTGSFSRTVDAGLSIADRTPVLSRASRDTYKRRFFTASLVAEATSLDLQQRSVA